MTKVWFISDTHNKHRELQVPEHDLLVHAGDFSSNWNAVPNFVETLEFIDWLKTIETPKLIGPGNHDTTVFNSPAECKGLFGEANAKLIIDDIVEFEGISFLFSPWVPTFGNVSMPFSKSRTKLARHWDQITEFIESEGGTDVLVSHGPPKGILDLAVDYEDKKSLVNCGDSALQRASIRVECELHCFGHIHSNIRKNINNSGFRITNGVTYLNASVVSDGPNLPLINNGYVYEFN